MKFLLLLRIVREKKNVCAVNFRIEGTWKCSFSQNNNWPDTLSKPLFNMLFKSSFDQTLKLN